MAPSTLDLFMLTFNCAKNLVNVAVFSSHLQAALSQNATGLPDLVVFSLQEVAPLSYSFIGSYFLNPFYSRFEEALNLAAVKLLTSTDREDDPGFSAQTGGSQGEGRATYPYTLVRAKNVGMTAIMLFSKTPSAIHHIEEAECGFGAADMGNKGAVGLRVTWTPGAGAVGPSGEQKTTELTFVATHLAAMEWNLKKRNANWRAIASSLTFANPRRLLPGVFPTGQSLPTPDRTGGNRPPPPKTDSADSSEAEEEEGAPLLPVHRASGDLSPIEPMHPDFPDLTATHHAALHDMSLFKPTSHLFIGGDLNYRISSTTPPPLAIFPSFDPDSDNHYPAFLERDQLTEERKANRTFHGLSEAPVRFGPTYKFNILNDASGAANEAAVRRGATINGVEEVPWKFASHRWPGWCDRILYLDVPGWVRPEGPDSNAPKMEILAYDGLPVMRSSDHRPVFLRAQVPLIEPDAMRPPQSFNTLEEQTDPRAVLPIPIDVHAWERRAAARRREIMVGWTAFFWSTRQGAVVMATFLLVGVSAWWVYKMW
ncbi:DNase I-like protein [Thozetella sp. PMI_491]|nr:DNase I-like protein [Thozetella sp. PMI_491]